MRPFGISGPSSAFRPHRSASMNGLGDSKIISGTVEEVGLFVSRVVHAHKRSNGQLVNTTKAHKGDGTYALAVPDTSDLYYVVALDDEAGTEYNALICDRV